MEEVVKNIVLVLTNQSLSSPLDDFTEYLVHLHTSIVTLPAKEMEKPSVIGYLFEDPILLSEHIRLRYDKIIITGSTADSKKLMTTTANSRCVGLRMLD